MTRTQFVRLAGMGLGAWTAWAAGARERFVIEVRHLI